MDQGFIRCFHQHSVELLAELVLYRFIVKSNAISKGIRVSLHIHPPKEIAGDFVVAGRKILNLQSRQGEHFLDIRHNCVILLPVIGVSQHRRLVDFPTFPVVNDLVNCGCFVLCPQLFKILPCFQFITPLQKCIARVVSPVV